MVSTTLLPICHLEYKGLLQGIILTTSDAWVKAARDPFLYSLYIENRKLKFQSNCIACMPFSFISRLNIYFFYPIQYIYHLKHLTKHFLILILG